MSSGVLVTGMGVINSIAHNISEFGESLKAGKSGIRYLNRGESKSDNMDIGANIIWPFDKDIEKMIPSIPSSRAKTLKKGLHRAAFSLETAIVATLEAWTASGLSNEAINGERVGLIVAGSNLTENYQYALIDKFRKNPEYLSPRYVTSYMDTSYVSVISESFGIKGEGFTVGGASASGNLAIIKAQQLIKLGIVDVCLVVGVVEDLSPMTLRGYSNVGAMAAVNKSTPPESICRPFDMAHRGFVLGQGAGCMVLESQESAEKRGVSGLVEVAGGAILLDGHSSTAPGVEGEERAMRSALDDAGVTSDEIDYINTHGTSTPLGDEVELEAIRKLLGRKLPDVWLNSTKSMIGHCLYSAGILEAIATTIQMIEGFVHPNLNLTNPIARDCRFASDTSVSAKINTSLNNSFGFGGFNTSVVLRGCFR